MASRVQSTKVLLLAGYGVTALAIVRGLVLVPVYLDQIGAELYGYWLGTGGILAWLSAADLGVNTLIVQRVAHWIGREDEQTATDYFWSATPILIAQILVALAIGFPLSLILPRVLSITEQFSTHVVTAFRIALLDLLGQLLVNFLSTLGQGFQRPKPLLFGRLAGGVISIVATILLIFQGYGLVSIALGGLMGTTLQVVIHAFHSVRLSIRAGLRIRIRPPLLRNLARVGVFTSLSKLGAAVVSRVEPTIIVALGQPELALVFELTKRAADIIKMVVERIAIAVYPGFASLSADRNSRRSESVLFAMLAILACVISIAGVGYVALNRIFVGVWVGVESYGGNLLTLFIAVGYLTAVYANSLKFIVSSLGEVRQVAVTSALGSLIRIVLLFLGFRAFGAIGLAVAVLLASVFVTLRLSHLVGEHYGSSARRATLAREAQSLIASLVGFVVAALLSSVEPTLAWFLLGATSLSCAALAISWLVDPDFRRGLRSFFPRLKTD